MNSKEKILSETARLIHQKGFNNTSVQDILDAASVTKSNFYYHFDTKEQLGFEVLAERMQQFQEAIIQPSLDNQRFSPLARLNAFLDRLLSIGLSSQGELGCPFGNLAQEMSPLHEQMRETISAFFSAGAQKIEQCFEDGKQCGDFDGKLPSKDLAEFILAQIQGAFLLRKTHRDPSLMQRNFEILKQIINGWTTRGERQKKE